MLCGSHHVQKMVMHTCVGVYVCVGVASSQWPQKLRMFRAWQVVLHECALVLVMYVCVRGRGFQHCAWLLHVIGRR